MKNKTSVFFVKKLYINIYTVYFILKSTIKTNLVQFAGIAAI